MMWKMTTIDNKVKDQKISTTEKTIVVPDLHARIAELAFYKAAQRGFELGHELGDWIEAEQEGVQIRKKIPIDLQAMEICR